MIGLLELDREKNSRAKQNHLHLNTVLLYCITLELVITTMARYKNPPIKWFGVEGANLLLINR